MNTLIFNIINKSNTIEKTVFKLISYIKYEDIQDIILDLYLEVFNIPEGKLNDLYNQGLMNLLNYIASICIYNLTNQKSRVLKKYQYNINFISIEEYGSNED